MPVWLDVVSKVATVIAVLIALSPFLAKALYLLRTQPPETEEERDHRLLMMTSGRVGWGQKGWVHFLDWFRTTDESSVSWKEWRARAVWCRLLRHKFTERDRPGQRYGGRCGRCWIYFTHDTEEGLEMLRRLRTIPPRFVNKHTRERIFTPPPPSKK